MTCRARAIAAVTLALLLCDTGVPPAAAQGASDAPAATTVPSLELTPEKVSHLNAAVAAHDYVAAEELLLKEIEPEAHSARAARLLAYLGSVYFLNHDYLNAAIAWKKSDAIAPLGSDLQFSLGDGVHSDFASGLGAACARITFCSRHQKCTVPVLARPARLRRTTLFGGDPPLPAGNRTGSNDGACLRQPWPLLLLSKRYRHLRSRISTAPLSWIGMHLIPPPGLT